jgi:hypothetical protein
MLKGKETPMKKSLKCKILKVVQFNYIETVQRMELVPEIPLLV